MSLFLLPAANSVRIRVQNGLTRRCNQWLSAHDCIAKLPWLFNYIKKFTLSYTTSAYLPISLLPSYNNMIAIFLLERPLQLKISHFTTMPTYSNPTSTKPQTINSCKSPKPVKTWHRQSQTRHRYRSTSNSSATKIIFSCKTTKSSQRHVSVVF